MAEIARLLGPRLRGQRNRWLRATPAERSVYALFALLGLGFWLGLFALVGWLVGSFHAVEVFGPILSRKLLELLILGLFALLCFSNLVTALSTFYLSEDLDLLLALPVRRSSFHFARLAETVVQSSWMFAFFGLPIFVAYGRAYQAGWPYAAAVAATVPPFVLLPAAIGLAAASTLVVVFPARRVREALVVLGILVLVALFLGLRLLRPERLVDASGFESLAAYVAQLREPAPLLAPPRWVSDVLMATLAGKPVPWLELGLLLTGAVAASGLARWLTEAVYDEGRARAQEARAARLARARWLDALLGALTRPLPPETRAIVAKDVKVFLRDPAQWSQVFLVGSIVGIALASVAALPMDMFRGPWADTWRNTFAFGAHALVGFIMAAVAARFQFTAVSAEGRAFWVPRTAPLTAGRFLWAKAWPTVLPMIAVGQVLAVASTLILGAGPWLVGIASATALGEAFGITGIALGMGARWPDFRADNVARLAAGPAGVLFMVAALSFTFAVVGLEVLPAWLILRAGFEERPLTTGEWAGVALPLLAAAGLCVAAAALPPRWGARALWRRELPGS